MAKKNREINVFSTSAIDLFASSLGVFIVLVVIIIPFYRKTSKITPQMVTELKEEVKQKKVIEEELKQVKKELELAKVKIESLPTPQDQTKIQQTIVDLKKTQIEKQEVTKELEKVQKEIRKLKIAQQNLVPKQNQTDAKKQIEKLSRQVASVQVEKEEIQKTLEKEVQEKVRKERDLNRKVEQLEATLKEKTANDMQGAFVAVIIKWSTPQHDIDLVVKDAKGKTFNFKRRSYPRHPGKFALDSRTGPGAELWQSARLIPGRYTITYNFYNPYGNDKPAQVTGTIFTKEGSLELPKTTLDFSKKRAVSFKVKVSPTFKVSLSS